MSKPESCSIQFADVDWNDTSCLITYGPLPNKLLLSIQAVGLLQKPLLQKKTGGLLRIICGSRRLAVCKEIGLKTADCMVLSNSLSAQACLRMAVYDNLAHRMLNPVEKSLVLTKMANYLEKSLLVEKIMPLLDLEPSVTIFNRYAELLCLEPVILDALAQDELHERTAFALTPLKQGDRLALFHLFEEFPFSVSVQEEIVEAVVEIGHRDKITPAEVVNSNEIRDLGELHRRPARQRAQEIRNHLQALRSPRLTARKQRFAREVRELGLPAGVRLVPPPYFEGPKWSLACTFERTEELATRLRHLARLAEGPLFRRIMEAK